MVPHYTQEGQGQVAPITGNHVGLKRAEIKQGVREVVLCKDGEGKMGLRVCSINKVSVLDLEMTYIVIVHTYEQWDR